MPKVRIVAEVLVVLALAFGIWRFMRSPDAPSVDPGGVAAAGPKEGGSSPRLLRGSKPKPSDPKPPEQPEVPAHQPLPTATPKTGQLVAVVYDREDQPVACSGWLIAGAGCQSELQVPVRNGVVNLEMAPLDCTLEAVLVVEGEEIRIRMPLVVEAGKLTRVPIYLPAPPETEIPAIAHAGVALLRRGDYAEVVEIVPGSSAAAEGLQVGDLVIQVGEFAVADLTQDEMASLLLGEPNSTYSLLIAVEQNGELIDGVVNLVRGIVVE